MRSILMPFTELHGRLFADDEEDDEEEEVDEEIEPGIVVELYEFEGLLVIISVAIGG